MATPHNNAPDGAIATTVLMPGDPLRAKFIADTFLENPRLFNKVRNMLGYTGTYKGKRVSVMGSGMGMPSIGIYSYELYAFYGVKNIIRIGSAGAYTADVDIYDVVLADKAYSESSYARTLNGYPEHILYPSRALNQRITETAARLAIPLHHGGVHSSDVFYRVGNKDYIKDVVAAGCIAVEMESFALFANALALGKNAACLVTISDSFVNGKATTPEERETSFSKMMKIALEAAE